MRKAGAMTALLAATGTAVAIGGIQLASADSVAATTGVNIRSGPGTNYKIIGGLATGQRISAIGAPHNGWVKVWFNGSVAYISAAYLDLRSGDASPGPAMIFTKGTKIATAPLNVRLGPSLGAKVIGYISDGQNVTLTGKQSRGFAEMLYGGERAWVSAQYLAGSIDALPKDTGVRYATADLFVRTSTDADFKIITTVRRGTELRTTGATRNGYAQIVYNNAIRWVTAKYLSNQRVMPSIRDDSDGRPDPIVVVGHRYATTELMIRTTPGSDFRSITDVPAGTRLSITGKISNGKAQVLYANELRWVTAQYLSTQYPSASRPQPDAAPSTPALPKIIGTRYATTELIIRSNPNADYRPYGTVPAGSRLSITGVYRNQRAQIVYRNEVRWVTAQYLSRSAPSVDRSASDSKPVAISSNRGEIALAYAKAQLGKPYAWGAEGPNNFDCSGLAMRAWQQAGVNLPRTSQLQFRASPRVAMSDLEPGDLVFFYGPNPSHVGIYAGNGEVIHAPRPGESVSYIPISYMPVAGATRPG